ncbi:MAG: GGDEF domain-containing protein [Gammaproteobacteria bacterium]|nr:MAG: GGDEF domain-containing protein [Gammaproteobacteria bacterium]
MEEPLLPVDEAIRIKTLRELNLLDTPAEERFDRLARLGGDEFTVVVVVVELNQPDDVEQVAKKVLEELSSEFRLGEESVYLSASIGIAFYPDHGEDMDSLIRSADRAMYDAKNNGRNRYVIANKQ